MRGILRARGGGRQLAARPGFAIISRVELRRFFDRAVQASFHDLALGDAPVAGYLADMLTRFARTEQLFPVGVTVPRLETVVDLLLETQATWDEAAARFEPERELSVRRHIGDYTLFMTGLFRERVDRVASTSYYVSQGRRAYRFVSEHGRATSRRGGRDAAAVYAHLADRFEHYAWALDYARRVHFHDAPAHPFFRLHLR
jgi:hypothetical protein